MSTLTIDSPATPCIASMAMHLDYDVICPALIGRDPQLAAVRRVLARGREGNGSVALIVGEAGIGKSRLLRATIEEARGAITAAYQDHLEKAWLQELRNKYTVQVNKDVLYSIK